MPASWIPHRRADGETVGYLEIVGNKVHAYDVLGRPVGEPGDWLAGEETLDAKGLGFLSGVWTLDVDGRAERVRIVEVTPARIVVKADDGNAIGGPPTERWTLPWPEQGRLTAE